MEYTDDEAALKSAQEHSGAGRFAEALEIYQQVVARKPRDLVIRQKAADMLARLGRVDDAVTELQVIADRFSRDGMLLLAMAVLQAILELQPGHAQTQKTLAELYARKHGRPLAEGARAVPRASAPGVAHDSGEFKRIKGMHGLMEACAEVVKDTLDRTRAALQGESDAPDVQLSAADLPETPLFADLSPEAFLSVTGRLQLVRARAGEIIIKEGDIATSMFIVIRGSVSVTRQVDEGELQVAELTAGAFFGEMGLLTNAPRLATVTAVEDTLLFELTQQRVDEILEEHPGVQTVLEQFHRKRLVLNLVATNALFRALTSDERREMTGRFEHRVVEAGETLLKEGEAGDGLYMLVRGRCQVHVAGKGDVATLREGDVFGEMSLVFDSPCSATVTTLAQSAVLRLEPKAFRELVPPKSKAAQMLQKLASERRQQVLDCG